MEPEDRSSTLSRALAPAALVLVVVAAALVRLADLARQPGGLYPDEGAEGLDAWRILHEPGYHPLWFYTDAGREVLYGYTVAGVFKFFGENAVVLRGVSAVFGVLGVVAIYFALRRFGRGAALAGAAWTAGSLWLIAVSRDGMRNITVPLAGALVLWALIAWADRPSRRTAIVAGLAAGAGFWTYQPMKLTPLLVVLWLAWIWRRDRRRYHRMMRQLRWIEPAFLLVVAPLLVFAIIDPNAYFSRAVSVSPIPAFNRSISLVDHSLRTLGMFAITGDPNERHDVNGLPLLGWPIFALACLGAWRAWRNRDDPAHSLLLLGIPVFLVPPLLGVDGGVPHFLRSLGLAPFLAGLIGIGSAEVVDRARAFVKRDWARLVAIAGVAVLMVGMGIASANAYFSRPVADRYEPFSFDVAAMSRVANQPGSAVIVDDYNEMDVLFIAGSSRPAIYRPGVRIDNPERYQRVLARDKKELALALGDLFANDAALLYCDPLGRPRVWIVEMSDKNALPSTRCPVEVSPG
jgi:hypothetical protein